MVAEMLEVMSEKMEKMMKNVILDVENLNFAYEPTRPVLRDISLELYSGESLGIIGPNGSGKTTLLKLLTGILPIQSGSVKINGKSLNKYSKRELAKLFAVVEQEGMREQAFTVEEIVTMGRYPWKKLLSNLTEHDYQIIGAAITTFELEDLRYQTVANLSGGERQLVSLGRVMAQEPQILFLDEPTTYLDIGNQLLLMHHVRSWQQEQSLTIMMVLHDLNLVAQYCDRLLLLNQAGEIAAMGTVAEVMTAEHLETAYGIKPIMIEHPLTGVPQIIV